MSARQQSKRAKFAAYEKSYVGKMNRKHRGKPGYMGVVTDFKINGKNYGKGVLFTTSSMRSRRIPVRELLHDEVDSVYESGDAVVQLAQTRTATFVTRTQPLIERTPSDAEIEASFYKMRLNGDYRTKPERLTVLPHGGCGVLKSTEITGKMTTTFIDTDRLAAIFGVPAQDMQKNRDWAYAPKEQP